MYIGRVIPGSLTSAICRVVTWKEPSSYLSSFLPLHYLENAVSVIGNVLVMKGFLWAQVSGAVVPLTKAGWGAEVSPWFLYLLGCGRPDSGAASAWLMTGLNQMSPHFDHAITPGILAALHSVLKYQAGRWSCLEHEVSCPLLCCWVLAQGILNTQQNSFKSTWDIAQQGFELIFAKAPLFLTLPTPLSRGPLAYMWPPVSWWKRADLTEKLTWRWNHRQYLSSGSSLNSLLHC